MGVRKSGRTSRPARRNPGSKCSSSMPRWCDSPTPWSFMARNADAMSGSYRSRQLRSATSVLLGGREPRRPYDVTTQPGDGPER